MPYHISCYVAPNKPAAAASTTPCKQTLNGQDQQKPLQAFNKIEENSTAAQSAEDKFFRLVSEALREIKETPFSVISDPEKLQKLLELTAQLKESIEKIEKFSALK